MLGPDLAFSAALALVQSTNYTCVKTDSSAVVAQALVGRWRLRPLSQLQRPPAFERQADAAT